MQPKAEWESGCGREPGGGKRRIIPVPRRWGMRATAAVEAGSWEHVRGGTGKGAEHEAEGGTSGSWAVNSAVAKSCVCLLVPCTHHFGQLI